MTKERNVELSTRDELLDQARLPERPDDLGDPLTQGSFVVDDAPRRDSRRAVFVNGLDDERKRKVAGILRAAHHEPLRSRDPGLKESLLHAVFVEGVAERGGR